MKADLDRLMQKRNLVAIVVIGDENYSDIRDYMSQGAHISGGYIVKRVGDTPRLYVNGMEIEEARKSGYPCKTYGDIGLYELMERYGVQEAQLRLWERFLHDAGVTEGRVGLYGVGNLHTYLEFVKRLQALLPQYVFVGDESTPNLFQEAYLTKDASEMARIHDVARKTNDVVALTWDYIASHRADASETLIKRDGTPLTVGDVKRFVRVALLERGLEDTGMIFAQGRDGGFPHSRGEEAQALRMGQAIVFDLFPRELGGGYHHDMTRTWSIGYATPEVQRAYDDVMTAFDIALETYAHRQPAYRLQEAVQSYFESKGHPTIRTTQNPTEGYVHSLGHGVGLNIHESPALHHLKKADILEAGNFITIEPGLYYPEAGFGVRIEDSFIINESGELISITPFKKDLILPIASQED
jgi:Xaa-Pro aminopeptidase